MREHIVLPPPPVVENKPLPRDILLAKARAYRETHSRGELGAAQPEQLSMNVDETDPFGRRAQNGARNREITF